MGKGSNGSAGSNTVRAGGGSGGEDGGYATNSNSVASGGGEFGGGSGRAGTTSYQGSWGGNGGVRIVWPGDTRQFPSTDVNTPY
jgi:hypothetical protein